MEFKSGKYKEHDMTEVLALPPRKRTSFAKKNIVVPVFSDEDADLRNEVWVLNSKYASTGRSDDNWKVTVYRAHRIVMSRMVGRMLLKSEDVDHINRNKLDNRRCNLRLATRSQNMQNQGKRRDNTSGFRGVSWQSNIKKWCAAIQVNKKKIVGGYFRTATEANEKVVQMRKEYSFFDCKS